VRRNSVHCQCLLTPSADTVKPCVIGSQSVGDSWNNSVSPCVTVFTAIIIHQTTTITPTVTITITINTISTTLCFKKNVTLLLLRQLPQMSVDLADFRHDYRSVNLQCSSAYLLVRNENLFDSRVPA